MKNKRTFDTKRLCVLAILVSLAMILSYLETLIPAFVAVPGVKLGLANVASIFALYTLGAPSAAAVSLIRVCLSSLLFGNVTTLIYSLSGAFLSLSVMIFLKKLSRNSVIGVSAAGGVMHNAGQILAAMAILGTAEILGYLPVLIVSGVAFGIVIGITAGLVIARVKEHIK